MCLPIREGATGEWAGSSWLTLGGKNLAAFLDNRPGKCDCCLVPFPRTAPTPFATPSPASFPVPSAALSVRAPAQSLSPCLFPPGGSQRRAAASPSIQIRTDHMQPGLRPRRALRRPPIVEQLEDRLVLSGGSLPNVLGPSQTTEAALYTLQ